MEANFESKKISEINNYFIKVFCNVDFEYVFTTECMHLISFASKIDKTSDLALKLHSKFIEPILNIIRDRAKQYALPDYIYFKTFYCSLSKDERLKIKKFISNNIDIFEIVFTPMHEFFDRVRDHYCFCNQQVCNCEKNCKCIYDVYYCNVKNTLCNIARTYLAINDLKYLYLSQKCIKNNKHIFGTRLDTVRNMFYGLEYQL